MLAKVLRPFLGAGSKNTKVAKKKHQRCSPKPQLGSNKTQYTQTYMNSLGKQVSPAVMVSSMFLVSWFLGFFNVPGFLVSWFLGFFNVLGFMVSLKMELDHCSAHVFLFSPTHAI